MNPRWRNAMLVPLAFLCACEGHESEHDHSTAHPAGHDHHQEGHGHGGAPTVSFTLWSDELELFAEHAPLIPNREASLLLHVTVLDGFRALESGQLRLQLEGPATLRGESSTPLRPGIFRIDMTPSHPGAYRGELRVTAERERVVGGIALQVFDDPTAAAEQGSDDDDHGAILFLKEQQWGVPFNTAFAHRGRLVSSVEVSGRIETPPGGTAEVGAPVTGRVIPPRDGLPPPGVAVRKGQVLATFLPAPASPEEAARGSLAVAEAEARASSAGAALRRAERLLRDEAIPQRELEDARREVQVAGESVRAARRAADIYSGVSGAGGRSSWRLTAPIDGTLESVHATPGATASPGQVLFRVVNTAELWIVARVPEQDAARVRADRDGSFQVAGQSAWTPIDITGDDATASVVMLGRTVDSVSRTVDLIYALRAPSAAMRVGGLVQVSVPAGADFDGVIVPRSALVVQEGRSVVYVQVDGEHFQERLVRTGPHAGSEVGIVAGLDAGARIVTEGAHLLRLADRASGAEVRGHIH
jgi:RND family efflux transporter MFP subunit